MRLHQKLLLVVFGLALVLCLLEAGLRLAGFFVVSQQERRNAASLRQGGTYRIVCIGESTTSFGGTGAYPQQLEGILNQRVSGMRFSVINAGMASTVTRRIVEELGGTIERYKPDMIIAMIGVNDTVLPLESLQERAMGPVSALRSLRVYKLARIAYLHLASRIAVLNPAAKPGIETAVFLRRHFAPKKIDDERLMLFVERDEAAIQEELRRDPGNEELLCELGYLYLIRGRLVEAETIFKKVTGLYPRNDLAYMELGWINKRWGRLGQANAFHRKAMELNPKNNTYLNLQDVKDMVCGKGIVFVCAQYPLRSIAPLKALFAGQNEVVFVDNESTFKEAVSREGYSAYFFDRFAGDFGHCTEKGNRLLAENIAAAVLRALGERQ